MERADIKTINAGIPSLIADIHGSQQAGGAGPAGFPSLSFDFTKGTLTSQVGGVTPTFTRATVATFWGSNGLLQTAASGAPRFAYDPVTLLPLGLQIEEARTQILATADIRDMTTVAWVTGATMTSARTSVGADGAANSATRLTGGAVAATNTCYTTVTAAASSRTYSALVKRVTGTGPVRIVQTGTETDISALINSTTYTMVELNASVLNVAIGFKIDTNLDAIDVDFNQFEAGAFATSRIPANGARNADSCSLDVGAWFSAVQGTLVSSLLAMRGRGGFFGANIGTDTLVGYGGDGSANVSFFAAGTGSFALAVGTNADGNRKQASAFSAGNCGSSVNGQAPITTALLTGMPTITKLWFGSRGGADNYINGFIKRLDYYPVRVGNSTLPILSK